MYVVTIKAKEVLVPNLDGVKYYVFENKITGSNHSREVDKFLLLPIKPFTYIPKGLHEVEY
jgi:hypothetical protein